MDHAGQASGREAVGEAFAVAVSMIFGQAETGLHTLKAILLATLGWESRRDI
jgi:ornithine carbamoyltransferase